MDAGKGAAGKGWKDQLAELDRERGWDDRAGNLDWDEQVDKSDKARSRRQGAQQGKILGARRRKSRKPVEGGREVLFYHKNDQEDESAIVSEDDDEYFNTVETMGDEPVMRPFSSRSRQEDGAVSGVDRGGDTAAGHKSIYQSLIGRREDFELRPGLMTYLEHRFGPNFDYEDRCFCHEWLVDHREQRIRTERMYYAHAGTVLLKEGCVLRVYPQDDLPGTEDIDKPVVTVTTPDGEIFWPHHEPELTPQTTGATNKGPTSPTD